MGHWRRGVLAILVALPTAACSSASPPAAAPTTAGHPAPVAAPLRAGARMTLPASPLTPDQQLLHGLNRLGYVPRPGDVERVRRIGLAAYVDEQLSPSSLADPAVEQALPAYPVLARSAADLVREYPQPTPQVRQQLASGQMSRRAAAEIYPPERRPAVITAQMQAARVTRAVLSERQLEEVLVDFWFNHFNVYAQKGAVRWMLPAYEREAIRPHVLGRFRDLVLATARHPAMLFYLDNWLSTRSDLVVPRGPNAGRRAGLNENYARELMELHTLGVDGGYTQQDVVEVARCFTGWTIDRPQQGGGFVFRTAAHDRGEKRVLGQVIPAGGGREDGERVIDILARHPASARFIATATRRAATIRLPAGARGGHVPAHWTEHPGGAGEIPTSPEFPVGGGLRAGSRPPRGGGSVVRTPTAGLVTPRTAARGP